MKIDLSKLSHEQRQHRMNIRNAHLASSLDELRAGRKMAIDSIPNHPSNKFKSECIGELITELITEATVFIID